MKDLLEYFGDYIPFFVDTIVKGYSAFLVSLAVVFVVGRMLNLVNSYRVKNLIALIVAFSVAHWITFIDGTDVDMSDFYWRVVFTTSVAVVLYVLIGFDLFDRFNSWCDKKFGSTKKKDTKDKKESK